MAVSVYFPPSTLLALLGGLLPRPLPRLLLPPALDPGRPLGSPLSTAARPALPSPPSSTDSSDCLAAEPSRGAAVSAAGILSSRDSTDIPESQHCIVGRTFH